MTVSVTGVKRLCVPAMRRVLLLKLSTSLAASHCAAACRKSCSKYAHWSQAVSLSYVVTVLLRITCTPGKGARHADMPYVFWDSP